MRRLYQESLFAVWLRLILFWWIVLTFIAIGRDPGLLENLSEFLGAMYFRLWHVGMGCFAAVALVPSYLFLIKKKTEIDLTGRTEYGLKTTIGSVPLPVDRIPRVMSKAFRLPIMDERIAMWLLSQNVPVSSIVPTASTMAILGESDEQVEKHRAFRERLDEVVKSSPRLASLASGSNTSKERRPITPHGKLFLAIWDTYCAHKQWPASHRRGGHGNRRLHEHCLAVASQCLHEISPEGGSWTFGGVYVKRRGGEPVLRFPNSTGYQLSLNDPLIPIVGLAHDLGKLVAYEVDRNGNIQTNHEEGGNSLYDDDRGVIHDVLGPPILSQMAEFWALDERDRFAINAAVAHYHHPSQFPLNNYRQLYDPRGAALMMLVITADKAVGAEESGMDTSELAQAFTEDAKSALYESFVSILTTSGRINGFGNGVDDQGFRIGQKHADFVVIKCSALLSLIRQSLGLSLESGERKHELTNRLLGILHEKGLLYCEHNGVDFSAYLPMYRVGLYHHESSKHFGDVAPALLIKVPGDEFQEFYSLTHLAVHPANAVVKNLILSHVKEDDIDPAQLKEQIKQAFDREKKHGEVYEEVTDDSDGEFLTRPQEIKPVVPSKPKKTTEAHGQSNEKKKADSDEKQDAAQEPKSVTDEADPAVISAIQTLQKRSDIQKIQKAVQRRDRGGKEKVTVADLGEDLVGDQEFSEDVLEEVMGGDLPATTPKKKRNRNGGPAAAKAVSTDSRQPSTTSKITGSSGSVERAPDTTMKRVNPSAAVDPDAEAVTGATKVSDGAEQDAGAMDTREVAPHKEVKNTVEDSFEEALSEVHEGDVLSSTGLVDGDEPPSLDDEEDDELFDDEVLIGRTLPDNSMDTTPSESAKQGQSKTIKRSPQKRVVIRRGGQKL